MEIVLQAPGKSKSINKYFLLYDSSPETLKMRFLEGNSYPKYFYQSIVIR